VHDDHITRRLGVLLHCTIVKIRQKNHRPSAPNGDPNPTGYKKSFRKVLTAAQQSAVIKGSTATNPSLLRQSERRHETGR
jgi:hypothetical protein